MIYFIGGASRSGKSLLASRMMTQAGVPWLSLDVLRMGLVRGAPVLGLNAEADDLEEAARLWPIIRAMTENMIDDGRDYLIEGACLDPCDVATLVAAGEARACFLGYPRLSAKEKAGFVLQFRDGPNDWLTDEPRQVMLAHLLDGCRTSRRIEKSCGEVDLPFFDTGCDFGIALSAAERWLVAGQF
ncbi:hypothetical protein QLH51_06740 [Sphingomonas sp. 2R-10]|uniref:AAA family ATPase n=1 Tax=Sphingomonas sp. 2R-10 TaxID=3045148 RepID=UPI000F79F913|nr:AAA family ATPase [Sphingomonas sp. 2R-10]MDJ0276489.1 hypothetical protein [Sphingomonas sp. 2R-10]